MYCAITGENYQTSARCLTDPFQIRFKRGAEDTFFVTTPKRIGKVEEIKVWHDDSGSNPSWFLCKVSLHDLTQGKVYHFLCNQWLAVEYQDGQIERSLTLSSKRELHSFRNVFYEKLKYNFTEYHLWLSVVFRPTNSNFTRVQRLSCCLSIIYTAILVSVLISKFTSFLDEGDSFVIDVPPFCLSMPVLILGFCISILLLPVHLILMFMFRSIKRKPKLLIEAVKEQSEKYATTEQNQLEPYQSRFQSEEDFGNVLKWLNKNEEFENGSECNNGNTNTTGASNLGFTESVITFKSEDEMNEMFEYNDKHVNKNKMPKNTLRNKDNSCKYLRTSTNTSTKLEKYITKSDGIEKNNKLPYKCVGMAWFVMISFIFSSAFAAIVYSMQFSSIVCQMLVTSVVVALISNLFLIEPLKVVVLSIAKTLNPTVENTLKDDININVTDNENLTRKNNSRSFVPQMTSMSFTASKRKKENRRQQRLKEVRITRILKELLFYSIFLGCLAVVGMRQRDSMAYQLVNGIRNIFDGKYSGTSINQVAT